MYRLRELREDADLSQKEVAKRLFLHTMQFFRYESGQSDVPLQLAIRIAELYNVSIDYLAGISNRKREQSPEQNRDVLFAQRIKKDYEETYKAK